jgi:hypothetical protein
MKYLRRILEGKEENVFKVANDTIERAKMKGISEVTKSEGCCTVKVNLKKGTYLSSLKKIVDKLSEINNNDEVEMSEMELWTGPKGDPQLVVDFYTEGGDDSKKWLSDLPF